MPASPISQLEAVQRKREQAVADMLAVGIYMHEPPTEEECRRALHVLSLANYEVKKRPPEKSSGHAG